MNKIILMGRLVRDPELKQTNGNPPVSIANFTLAVNRRFKQNGQPDADFINCIAFGKNAEFVTNYFQKGQLVSVVGRLQVRSWDNSEGKKQWATEVVVEENYFAESKKPQGQATQESGFYPVNDDDDDGLLPF